MAAPGTTQADLYQRGCATLVASWEEYARGSTEATLLRLPGVAVGIFPNQPERGVYNNALLDRGLGPRARTRALDALESAYAGRGIDHYNTWVHETDSAMRTALTRRGYLINTVTRAMGMALDDIRAARPDIEVGPADWSEYARYEGFAPDFLKNVNHDAFRILAVRDDGEIVAAALAYDFETDCGIYNVGTIERARRRGLGSAITLALLHAARARGCRTASLQATQMAERLYAKLGLRDLGRFLEYVPAQAR
jgi:ribosomal protein S18 acetylase RimI-like enzyme